VIIKLSKIHQPGLPLSSAGDYWQNIYSRAYGFQTYKNITVLIFTIKGLKASKLRCHILAGE